MRALVFDDDPAIGRLVVRVAALAGMQATAVADAQGFAQQLQANPPQLIVLDLQLGDTDGVTQLRLLAERNYTGALVLMSGFDARVLATSRMLGEKLGLGLVGALEKPLQVAELQKLFEQLLATAEPLSAQRLLEAIAGDELGLDFQPVVTREPKELRKLEALVRWDHPVAGRVPPGRFLPAAERDRAAIDALTDWVVAAAVEAYRVLAQLGVGVPIAVNLSTRNLHDLSLPDRIGECLRVGGMPARHLCLEVTETAAFEDVGLTMDILSRIRLKGMSLSIDDFGTGYSSLKFLRQMPFSELKIDQSFVRDMTTSRDSRVIVKTIVDLAANMGMAVVAEGVETEDSAALLEQMGVAVLQGFLIARPMPVEAVAAWLAIWQHGAVPEDQAAPLSPGQIAIMQMLADGAPVHEIARRLGVERAAIKVQLSQAYIALGAPNRSEAVRRFGAGKPG